MKYNSSTITYGAATERISFKRLVSSPAADSSWAEIRTGVAISTCFWGSAMAS